MERVKKFMLNRYGTDQLNLVLLSAALISSLLATIVYTDFFITICWIPLMLYAYRAFSKDLIKRYRENAAFLKIVNPVIKFFYIKSAQTKDRQHKYICCPYCSQTLSVEKKAHKNHITCPVCKNSFENK